MIINNNYLLHWKVKGVTLYALSNALAHKSMKVTEYYYATYDKSSLDADLSRAFD